MWQWILKERHFSSWEGIAGQYEVFTLIRQVKAHGGMQAETGSCPECLQEWKWNMHSFVNFCKYCLVFSWLGYSLSALLTWRWNTWWGHWWWVDLLWLKVNYYCDLPGFLLFLSSNRGCFAPGDPSLGIGSPATAGSSSGGIIGSGSYWGSSPTGPPPVELQKVELVHSTKKNVFSTHLLSGSKGEDSQHGFISTGCFWWRWAVFKKVKPQFSFCVNTSIRPALSERKSSNSEFAATWNILSGVWR